MALTPVLSSSPDSTLVIKTEIYRHSPMLRDDRSFGTMTFVILSFPDNTRIAGSASRGPARKFEPQTGIKPPRRARPEITCSLR